MTPLMPNAHTTDPPPFSSFSVRSLVLIVLVSGLLGFCFVKQLDLLSGSFSLSTFLWLPALGLFAGAILAFGFDWPSRSQGSESSQVSLIAPQFCYLLVAGALVCAAVAGWEVQTGGSPTIAVVSWVSGIVLVLAAPFDMKSLLRLRLAFAGWQSWWWYALVLITILALGAIFRLVDLGTIPGFIHNDEANDGLQARSLLQGQVPTIFTLSSWSLLPMLVHTWYAAFLGIFGDSLVSQRLGSVVFGLLSILVVALLGKELFSWRTGFIAAALLAVYHFHIHFSRVGIQVISGDFVTPLTFLCLIRVLKYKTRFSAVCTGVMLTLDIHAYFGSRISFIIIPVFIVYLLISRNIPMPLSYIHLVFWMALGLLVSIAPIGVYILHNWGDFMGHTSHETVLSTAPDIQLQLMGAFGTHDLVYILRTELWRTILAFFYSGDTGLQYGTDYPMLDPISSSFWCGSVAYASFRIKKPGFALCIIATLSVLWFGGAMTINMPYWPRLIVLLPFVTLLLAAFIDDVWQAIEQSSRLTVPVGILALALFAGIANGNYQWYFNQFAPVSRQRFIAATMDVGLYLRSLPSGSYVYGLTDGSFYMSNEAIRFLAPDVLTCTVPTGLDFSKCPPVPTAARISFVVLPGREGAIPILRLRYPRGKVSVLHTYDLGQAIYTYRFN